MTADDDAVWGYGLGCNGAIELFVEPTGGRAGIGRGAFGQARAPAWSFR